MTTAIFTYKEAEQYIAVLLISITIYFKLICLLTRRNIKKSLREVSRRLMLKILLWSPV